MACCMTASGHPGVAGARGAGGEPGTCGRPCKSQGRPKTKGERHRLVTQLLNGVGV
jgi:hypothetical protein